jgi:hypothetical protein
MALKLSHADLNWVECQPLKIRRPGGLSNAGSTRNQLRLVGHDFLHSGEDGATFAGRLLA